MLANCRWVWGLPLRVVYMPSETPLKKTKFSLSGYPLERASGLGMGFVFTLSLGTPFDFDPHRKKNDNFKV